MINEKILDELIRTTDGDIALAVYIVAKYREVNDILSLTKAYSEIKHDIEDNCSDIVSDALLEIDAELLFRCVNDMSYKIAEIIIDSISKKSILDAMCDTVESVLTSPDMKAIVIDTAINIVKKYDKGEMK